MPAVGLDPVVLEYSHRRGHCADLVVAIGAGISAGDIAGRKSRHRRGELDDRLADAAADHHHQTGAPGHDSQQPAQRNQKTERAEE